MVNINKIRVILFDSEVSYLFNNDASTIHFDYVVKIDREIWAGLIIYSERLSFELTTYHNSMYKIYNITDINSLTNKYVELNKILDYVGLNYDTNTLIDLMNDNNVNDVRKFYLESVLYYKVAQYGRAINTFNLEVKHFDDLVNKYPEDFIEFTVKSNTFDYETSLVMFKTYLNEEELNDKFKNFLMSDDKQH